MTTSHSMHFQQQCCNANNKSTDNSTVTVDGSCQQLQRLSNILLGPRAILSHPRLFVWLQTSLGLQETSQLLCVDHRRFISCLVKYYSENWLKPSVWLYMMPNFHTVVRIKAWRLTASNQNHYCYLKVVSTHVYWKLDHLILNAYICYLVKFDEDGAWSDRILSVTQNTVQVAWYRSRLLYTWYVAHRLRGSAALL